jgi:hypothetical protein
MRQVLQLGGYLTDNIQVVYFPVHKDTMSEKFQTKARALPNQIGSPENFHAQINRKTSRKTLVGISWSTCRAVKQSRKKGEGTYSLVMWQTVEALKEQSHLMAGLMLGSLSTLVVVSAAMPLQGSPLMFHADDARRRHLCRIVFSAAAARVTQPKKNCVSSSVSEELFNKLKTKFFRINLH